MTRAAASAVLAATMTITGSYCKIATPGHRIIQTREQWQELWKDLGRAAPNADLGTHFAVAAFAGERTTGGYTIAFEEPVAEGATLVIRYRVDKPKGMAIMSLTQPYAVRLFPRTSKPVKVEARR